MSKALPRLSIGRWREPAGETTPSGGLRLRQRPSPMLSYAICATPRTGSTYLCGLLRKAGLGNPDEWLHSTRPRSWTTLEELRTAKAMNGIFAIKIFWTHREDLAIVDFDDLLPAGSTAWVYLHRKDINSQARSYLTAVARDEWMETKVPYLEFAPETIAQWEARLRRRNADWQSWFRRKKIRPLRVSYEAFVADPHVTVAAIKSFLTEAWAAQDCVDPSLAVFSRGRQALGQATTPP